MKILKSIARQHIAETDWLESQVQSADEFTAGDFYLSFNLIHRRIEDRPVEFTADELVELQNVYPGFRSEFWSTRSLARTFLVMHVPAEKRPVILDNLFSTADIQEQETLYRCLYLLPDREKYQYRGAEGIRTNMTRVFDALALDNPFPAAYFDEGQWNQMVLKAIFMQRPLYRIIGLDDRKNENLARIATDFAHERWAASRTVTPELWRLVTSFASDGIKKDIARVNTSESALEREAGALVLKTWATNGKEAHASEWNDIGKKLEENELH